MVETVEKLCPFFNRSDASSWLALVGTGPQFAQAVVGEKPNMIIVGDAMWPDVGCYGGKIQTPNIEGLAAECFRLAQFYNNAKLHAQASLVNDLYSPNGGHGIRLSMIK